MTMWTEKMKLLLGDPQSCRVSVDEFNRSIWSLHARGSFEESYINLELRLRRGVLLPGTKILTFELVKTKWSQYIDSFKGKPQNIRFAKSFQSWMDAQGYLENYGPPKRRNLFPGA